MSAHSVKHAKFHTGPALRRWLAQAPALASTTAVPILLPNTWAQTEPALARLPRTALVIGNAGYLQSPLRNPVNDAQAIAGALQGNGFEVTLLLDPARVRLAGAIRAFTQELASNKGIGFFFYAGHGAQHEWRNYLIPVDAAIGRPEDLPGATLELNSLLCGLTAAGNAANVVVLDACRHRPFGPNLPAGRGLAQFDAPPRTLLAYAAAPGTTVDDNGLYAGGLVHELVAPNTKVEDAFKRVRLALYRQTNGRQISWESSAIADDFYLNPPVQTGMELNKTQAFEAEVALWNRSRRSNDTTSLEIYLQQYPGGMFSELGEFRLERLLAQNQQGMVAAATFAETSPNPFSKGTFRANPDFSPGDCYTYTSSNDAVTETVTRVTRSRIIFDHGRKVLDLLGNETGSHALPRAQFLPARYAVGRKWNTRFYDSEHGLIEMTLRIAGKETISVPAGTFDAFKIEGDGLGSSGDRWTQTLWVAPDISRRPLATEANIRSADGIINSERQELASFCQKISPVPGGRHIDLQMARRLAPCLRAGVPQSCFA